MAEPHSFTLATANVNKSLRGTRLHTAVAKAATADVVCWQEVETPAHVTQIEALAGYVTYWPSGHAEHDWRNACPVSFRSARFALLDGGADEVGEGIAGVQPNRPLTWVILTDRDLGGKVAAVSCHTVSGVWKNLVRKFAQWLGRNRRAESDHELAAIAAKTRELATKYDVVVGGGDLNRAAKLAAHVLGADHVVYADKPTHGRHWFDVIWLVGATGTGAHTVATPSDHDVLACTVTPAGHPVKAPQHRKEPTVNKKAVDPPSPPFIAARHHGGNQSPHAIVMHATVSPDTPGTARNIAEWWHGPGSPDTSAHYVVDPKEVIQCVGDHTVAYHCGYNDGSIGVEMCDEETGPASRWADANSRAIIDRAAGLVAQLCLAYDIEPTHVGVPDLKAHGPHGIYSHNQSRLAFGHTTHTDPEQFPWTEFMGKVHAAIKGGHPATGNTATTTTQEDDMANMRVPVPKNAPEYKTVKSADHTVAVDTAISMLWYRLEALINEVDKLKAK